MAPLLLLLFLLIIAYYIFLICERFSWLGFSILLLLILVAGYYFYNHPPQQEIFDPPDEVPEEEEEEEEEEIPKEIPSNFELKDYSFSLNKGTVTSNEFTYQDLKKIYLDPEFIHRFQQSIITALKLKTKRIRNIRSKYRKDLQAMRSKSGDFMTQLLDKNQDVSMIESTISEMDSLLKEIQKKKVTFEETKRNLISALTDRSNGIDSIVGRDEIKNFLAIQLYTFSQNPKVFLSSFQNMVLYAPAGAGKSKIAQVIAHVYANSGILLRNHVQLTTPSSLSTAYVNESGRMTKKLLLSNLESVVIIDEAYQFGNNLGYDHSKESITEIVNFIDKMIGLSLIIAAGYKEETEKYFINTNQGLPRRFPHKISLTPYSSKELTQILLLFLADTCPKIKDGNFLYSIIDYVNKKKPEVFAFGGGDMLNLSSFISRSVYGTPGKVNEATILNGINNFLATKGISLEMEEQLN